MQPLSHSPGNTHLDTDDIDALPISYKKKAPKSRERNAFHVRDWLLLLLLTLM